MSAARIAQNRARWVFDITRVVWLVQHLRALTGTLVEISRSPGTAIITASVIGLALALPAGLYLTLDNLNSVVARWGANPQITVFLTPTAGLDQAEALATRLKADRRFTSVSLIDRTQALADFRASSGFGSLIDELPQNPLPHILVLDAAASLDGGEEGAALAEELSVMPAVAAAQLDIAWVRRLRAITEASERVVLVLACALGFGVILVVGNTIKIGIHNRRDEIEIAKLCGATDAFVRRPFLYSGALHGFIGGAVACTVVFFGILLVDGPIERLSTLYDSTYRPHSLSATDVAMTLAIGAGLGWSGAWLAVGMYLREIDVTRN